MFALLMKNKMIIENKVSELQGKYLENLQVYSKSTENDNDEEIEKVKKELREKLKVVSRILNNYKVSLQQNHELKQEVCTARDVALSIESEVDLLCMSLNLHFPDELKKHTRQDQLSDENNEEEEEEEESDKENSVIPEEIYRVSSSDEYFSPNIQVRKSTIDSEALFTPAIKSNTKSKLPIRHPF